MACVSFSAPVRVVTVKARSTVSRTNTLVQNDYNFNPPGSSRILQVQVVSNTH